MCEESTASVSPMEEILQVINDLAIKSVDGQYIFRGESQCYEKVSSSLYREFARPVPGEPNVEILQIAELGEAKRFTAHDDEIAILTELQHYGGKTNLIDFTTDYLIALFFACEGSFLQNGRVVFLDRAGPLSEHIFEPKSPASRVLAQKSVFVRPPTGIIDPDKEITIPHQTKLQILDYLQKGHGISNETVYNDLHGFIRSRAIHREAIEHLSSALVHLNRKDFQTAVEFSDKALDLNPRMMLAHRTRGRAYTMMGNFDQAVLDHSRVLELVPNDLDGFCDRGTCQYLAGNHERAVADLSRALDIDPDGLTALNNRGNAFLALGELDKALADFDQSIEIAPDYPASHVGRGLFFHHSGDFETAASCYERAIALSPQNAIAYGNLGEAWLHLFDWGKARANLITARSMGADIAVSFHQDYESVSDFEEKYGVEVPSDLAELLTG